MSMNQFPYRRSPTVSQWLRAPYPLLLALLGIVLLALSGLATGTVVSGDDGNGLDQESVAAFDKSEATGRPGIDAIIDTSSGAVRQAKGTPRAR